MDSFGFGYYFSKEQIEEDFALFAVAVASDERPRRQMSSRRS